MTQHTEQAAGTFAALCADDPELAALRADVRDFLRADQRAHGWRPAVDSWLSCWDEGFSARLGAAGFVGVTIPPRYGGGGRGHLHRYVVTEELLGHGAPVAAHWIADRQLAPALLSYGSEEQRERILPAIAAGRYFSAIGMSEHGAGSDLAAVQTKATKTADGWILNGAKVWSSGAHHAHHIVVLARTAPADPEHRHAGFSQFLVPRGADGVTVSPIELMSGEHHFNEVIFDGVFVADADLLGAVGAGWAQVTSELSFERSGPERILTTMPLLTAAIRALATRAELDAATRIDVGHLVARLVSLRQLSVSVARALVAGESAANQAALVKDLGTRFEQDSVELIAGLLERAHGDTELDPALEHLLTTARLHKPLFTLRGGTNEVLRGVVARGMGLR
ncbi:acyl-CoA dehydrogenase family protein [Mycolicibacterium sp.]|uniref:acyl-CoA dehydrogenase family protein n=1 Tax=Mycolicibacterium sp. TaxID=2320850 RepID=UPI003D099C96